MSTLGVILAGGLARRMGGQDKAFLHLKGKPLLDRAIARLGAQVDGLAINSNADAALFDGYAPALVPDLDDSRAGPLAGVLAGLTHAREVGASHIVTVAVDTPFFPLDLTVRLRDATRTEEKPLACVASGGRAHPVFGYWPVALRDDLADALASGERKVDRWTGRHGCAVVSWYVQPYDPFFNVNTPEDLAEAERLAG